MCRSAAFYWILLVKFRRYQKKEINCMRDGRTTPACAPQRDGRHVWGKKIKRGEVGAAAKHEPQTLYGARHARVPDIPPWAFGGVWLRNRYSNVNGMFPPPEWEGNSWLVILFGSTPDPLSGAPTTHWAVVTITFRFAWPPDPITLHLITPEQTKQIQWNQIALWMDTVTKVPNQTAPLMLFPRHVSKIQPRGAWPVEWTHRPCNYFPETQNRSSSYYCHQ